MCVLYNRWIFVASLSIDVGPLLESYGKSSQKSCNLHPISAVEEFEDRHIGWTAVRTAIMAANEAAIAAAWVDPALLHYKGIFLTLSVGIPASDFALQFTGSGPTKIQIKYASFPMQKSLDNAIIWIHWTFIKFTFYLEKGAHPPFLQLHVWFADGGIVSWLISGLPSIHVPQVEPTGSGICVTYPSKSLVDLFFPEDEDRLVGQEIIDRIGLWGYLVFVEKSVDSPFWQETGCFSINPDGAQVSDFAKVKVRAPRSYLANRSVEDNITFPVYRQGA